MFVIELFCARDQCTMTGARLSQLNGYTSQSVPVVAPVDALWSDLAFSGAQNTQFQFLDDVY